MYYLYLQDGIMEKLGVQEFRPCQKQVFEKIFSARNVFAIIPTAGGKSLLYQLPALMGDGLTLVFSPTKSLQVDQVTKLRERDLSAAYCNSDLSKAERKAVLDGLPHTRLLYIAPEQLQCEDMQEALARCHVSRVAIDEAHILPKAQMGFRRAYAKIGEFIASLSRKPQVIICTATATKRVRKQILGSLGVEDVDIFQAPVRRENLKLQIKKLETQKSLRHAVERALDKWKHSTGRKKRGSVIIYCPTVREVKRTYQWLKARDWKVQKYTGKTPQRKREQAIRRFMSGEYPIMVATNAFGLGIDKPDVRLVIHAGMPLSLDGYVQEFGRAGRDGKAAKCLLLYTPGDYGRNKAILNHAANKKSARQGVKDLNSLAKLLKSKKCLWQQIERYFGEKSGKPCKKCCRCEMKRK